MRTSNPALQQFVQPQTWDSASRGVSRSGTMTINGTAIKTGILLAICASIAVIVWSWANTAANPGVVGLAAFVSMLIGLGLALLIHFKPATAPIAAPIYAVAQGVLVGAISWIIPRQFNVGPIVAFQAAGLTFGILTALLIAYSAGLVRLGSTATKVVMVGTGGVAIYYMVIIVGGLLGFQVPNLGTDASPMGIGFSLLVIALASLNLVLDFQFIEAGVARKAPKHMEWYGAVGLLVTLVWLYIETLRLLAKMRK